MLLDDLETYLLGAGVTDAIDKGELHDAPDTVVALRETGGLPSEHTMGGGPGQAILEVFSVQILARAFDYVTASTLIWSVRQALDGLRDITLNGAAYYFVTAIQPPFLLMRDVNQRYILAFNVLIRRQTTTS